MKKNNQSPLSKIKYGHRITLGFGAIFGFITLLHTINQNNFTSTLTLDIEPKKALETLHVNEHDLINQYLDRNKNDFCFVTVCDDLKITINKNNDSTFTLDWQSASNRSAKDENFFENKLAKYIERTVSEEIKSLLIIEKSILSNNIKKLSVKKAELEGFNRAHKLTGDETPLTTIAKKLKSLENQIEEANTKLRFQESINKGQAQIAVRLRQKISLLLNEKKQTIKPLLQDSNIHIKVAKKDGILMEIKKLEALIAKTKADIKLIKSEPAKVNVIHTI